MHPAHDAVNVCRHVVTRGRGRYFPVFTKFRISSVSRVSPVLIEYISDMWLCCGTIVACAHPPGRSGSQFVPI